MTGKAREPGEREISVPDERNVNSTGRLSDLDVEAHLRDPLRKQSFVTPMFDVIAPKYDRFTRLFSFGMDSRWKQLMVRAAVDGYASDNASAHVLDLAAGTGDVAIGIATALPNARVTAVDASPRMVDEATGRLRLVSGALASRISMRLGDMCALDIPDASIDVVTASYGVRNVPDAHVALREMRRVLRQGGKLILLDFYRPESTVWRTLFLWYLQRAGNAVGWWWYRDPIVYGYIARSIDHFVSWQRMNEMLAMHGFRVERVTRYLGGGVAQHEAIAV